jgi:hypothetical protein
VDSNPGQHGGKPAANSLSYSKAFVSATSALSFLQLASFVEVSKCSEKHIQVFVKSLGLKEEEEQKEREEQEE